MSRIAFFDDRYFEVYGAQENVLLLAELARDDGHEVWFVTTADGALADAARARGLGTLVVDAPERLKRFEKGAIRGGPAVILRSAISALGYSRRLHRELEALGIEVVVAAAVRPALLLARSRLAGTPATILFAQNSTPFGIFAAAALPGLAVLAPIASGALATFPQWAIRVVRPRIEIMASGRDLTHFDVQRPADDEDLLRVLSVGSLTPRKGFHDLIAAVAQLEDMQIPVELTIVGGTSGEESEAYADELRQRAARHDVPVRFVGWIDDIRPYLAEADVFALASSHEGLPGVIIEAMAAGLPVVATDAGGCREAVASDCGHIVPVGDVASLATGLADFEDQTRRRLYGERARRRAIDHFSTEAFYTRFERLLTKATTA